MNRRGTESPFLCGRGVYTWLFTEQTEIRMYQDSLRPRHPRSHGGAGKNKSRGSLEPEFAIFGVECDTPDTFCLCWQTIQKWLILENLCGVSLLVSASQYETPKRFIQEHPAG